MKFEDWFHETENFSLRAERFYDDLVYYQEDRPERIVEWLRAAYEAGREHGRKDSDDYFDFPGDVKE